MKLKKPLTYISLFSSAGVGCYGFKSENFYCVATVEILEKRLNIQRYNSKCVYESAYISDDITTIEAKNKIRAELLKWNIKEKANELDVLIATPPCQGMSVANHKKGNELNRNSLVIESILLTKEIKPKFFIFENVRAFLNTECTDIDGKDKSIKEAIEVNLAGEYHINYQVLNFKDYGNPSSRTRTLVIGTRKDLKEITPFNISPSLVKEKTLKETIGKLQTLKTMGEISETDIYHSFKKYTPTMQSWISDIKEGESAFDNKDLDKIPHKIVDGIIIYNANKNGDKYKRQYWSKVAPCVHTRNDILSSQNTVHPVDDRVFSIREVMLMMSVPNSFKWTEKSVEELNKLSLEDKKLFLKKEEMNIRHCLGEAVPTIIFQQIAKKIKTYLVNDNFNEQNIKKLIEENELEKIENLNSFIEKNSLKFPYSILSKIAELSNTARTENSAYYTSQDICYSVIKDLPEPKEFKNLKILEPSIGVGNFLPLLIEKYKTVTEVIIDVVDIDENSINTLKLLLKTLEIPKNITINFINSDFLLYNFENRYDIVVGNPPFKKITNEKVLLASYKKGIFNTETNNIFSFFIEKSLKLGNVVALIIPKSLINSPEFNKTRELLENLKVKKITDYGEKGFKGVKIETISFIAYAQKKSNNNVIEIESYITKEISIKKQEYIFSKDFPYWLIYRNDLFDNISNKMKFNIFNAYRDRQITKKITKEKGNFRVLKSRNIASNKTIDIKDYDCYTDEIESLDVKKFINNETAVLVPNLTYNPRACFLPKNTIVDGSVAILTLRNGSRPINENDLEYFGSAEFSKFYAVARNYGTRSLNIDNNSVFFFGILNEEYD
ncbi:TPA: DNA (cytosine-5-)-methyltransferase [Flavobacterium psychrophilum]|uniref:DNA (cytosine-5-)-methyltransferase n=2 Tax=Flavobacterium psychrophilum TaxID=96345 RepID=UPI000B7C4FEF|nr:DNA (cytosine-5-)-methyltransferase [Flavobacterium psychrophilum]SNB96918.1 Cytosine-specific methyltransferase [Flavobacterium psychrophilum]GEJ32969.1 DNA methyltransferase [Flavobacterium psychrophilum]GEJ36040.1 DNA methyltransferase [Flavobacterium psychrophilum]GEJ38231.1 DNA methyltransferase [Flavobacterium psychrophilum]GEJ38706.1 DNA methyltransferase [Flavobacterium psychrophilum]